MYILEGVLRMTWDEAKPKLSFQLQMNRSPSLFRVWQWEWYQTKANALYFRFLKTFFVFDKLLFLKFEDEKTVLDRILDQFHFNFTVWDANICRSRPKYHETSKIENTLFYSSQLHMWSLSWPNSKFIRLDVKNLELGNFFLHFR